MTFGLNHTTKHKMTITYYEFEDISFPHYALEAIQGKYANAKTLANKIIGFYGNVAPTYSISKFYDLTISEKFTDTRPVFKKDKKGNYVQKGEEKYESSRITQDFSKHGQTKDQFLNSYEFNGECKNWGYYEIVFGETSSYFDEEKRAITFSAQVFVKFFTAEKVFTREIKEPGKPYQPEKKEIKVLKESQLFPVLIADGKYSLQPVDVYFRSKPVFAHKVIHIYRNTLEIIED